MKITLHVDQMDSHAHVRMFINGGLAGKLCMTTTEFTQFMQILRDSPSLERDLELCPKYEPK
jgi:hypothetical protein